MTSPDQIPEDLLWQNDGHASDIAVTVLADGQDDIVASAVKLHVSACGYCSSRMGEAALASLDVGSALQTLSTSPECSPISARRGRFPLPWIAGGLVIAVVGLVPNLVDKSISIRDYWVSTLHLMPVIVRAAPILWNSLASEYGRFVPIASLVSAITLVLAGMALARAVPRKVSTVGGL